MFESESAIAAATVASAPGRLSTTTLSITLKSPRTSRSHAISTQRSRLLRNSATLDRKSTRLNSSHSQISYAVFCLKKKKNLCYQNVENDLAALPGASVEVDGRLLLSSCTGVVVGCRALRPLLGSTWGRMQI